MTPRQQSILVGALVAGVLSTSYLAFINVLCCLGVIIGGAVATQQYASRGGGPVASGDGAVLGALAGVGGAILSQVLNRILRPLGLGMQEIVMSWMEGMQGQGMSPEMMEQMQSSGGGMGAMLFNLVIGLVLYAIFGAIGGALGAAFFGGDEQSGDAQSGGTQAGGAQPGGAQPGGPAPEPQDDSPGGAESNREGSV